MLIIIFLFNVIKKRTNLVKILNTSVVRSL